MLQPLFEWMYGVGIYKSSIYLGPGVNLVHLVAMCTFMGALLIVDLRLLGTGLTTQPVQQVARSAQPWLIGGLLLLTLTGIPAVMTVALEEYANPVFWFKMYVLLAAVIFTFTVRRQVANADEARVPPVWRKLVALVSIVLWMSVAAGGRLIMYL
ncbi:MAG: DUF6644 family protein [Acidobacteriota bacterium]